MSTGDSIPCPLISCPVCPEGFHTEKPVATHGCDVSCKCLPDVPRKPCPMINCPRGRFGKCRNVDGCDICDCLPPCPPLRPCPRTCSLKFKNSCPYCHCDRPVFKPRCNLAMCLMFCENGFEKDENDCVLCKCKPQTCKPVRCRMYCKHGFKKNANGCEICRCNRPACPRMMCRMYCKHGYQRNANGCRICKCNPAIPMEIRAVKIGAPGSSGKK